MTRQDYEMIADAILLAKGAVKVAPYDAETAIDLLVTILADEFECDNERFSRRRFLEACEVSA